jgi:hypothetical protein
MAVPLVSVLLGALFLVLAAAAVGPWAWFVGGILILIALAFGFRSLGRRDLDVAADPRKVEQRRDPRTYNVVVVADAEFPPDALRRVVKDHAAGRTVTAFVVAPAVSSRLDRITGDESAYEEARGHLEATLGALETVSTNRDGKIGSHDPLQAIGEALREFPAEEILVPAQSDQALAAETRFGVHVTALTS